MTALAHDVRGATLAIMGAALIPFCGMVGGGIDLARMYITKTRLQHACDAGSLAGRKQMGSGIWGDDDRLAAEKFFDANFRTGAYGSSGLSRSFAENAGKVTGSASATVPMTLMRVLGKTSDTLSVTCDAEMRLPNTDIMFVLDTTGSMAQKAVNTDTDTKINSLKVAVKCFYEIVAKLDTNATCAAGAPSGGTGDQVQIRFGFMPYSTNVNVGHLLPASYFADSWNYQSREPQWTTTTTFTYDNPGNPTVTSTSKTNPQTTGSSYTIVSHPSATSATNCASKEPADTDGSASGSEGSPYNMNTTTAGSMQQVTYSTNQTYSNTQYLSYYDSSNGCYIYSRPGTYTLVRNYTRNDTGVPHTAKTFSQWRYAQIATNIAGLKDGSGWKAGYSLTLPLGSNGSDRSITWDGCIEERPTVSQTSYSPIPSTAYDLNIDLKPVPGDATTLWGPALNAAIYLRNMLPSNPNNYSPMNLAESQTATEYRNGGNYYCPTEAKKLTAWGNADDFDDYVDSLQPNGNTYHDIGMLWGARFLSPTGIFSTENAYTPKGGEIDRHMIFMTDGDAQAAPCDYAAYGLPWFDRRTTTDVGTAANCGGERSVLDDQVNARLEALCTAVKNKNITLWVISFGSGSNTTTETRLSNCATPGRYFAARNSAQLQATFASIANQISQLRLTQ